MRVRKGMGNLLLKAIFSRAEPDAGPEKLQVVINSTREEGCIVLQTNARQKVILRAWKRLFVIVVGGLRSRRGQVET